MSALKDLHCPESLLRLVGQTEMNQANGEGKGWGRVEENVLGRRNSLYKEHVIKWNFPPMRDGKKGLFG